MEAITRTLSLLRGSRDFTLLLATQLCAQAGDGIVQAALAKSIVFGGQEGFDLEAARSPDELLRIALYIFIPYTILSPFLGVLIDRWDRRRLLALANGFRAIVIAVVALATVEEIPDAALFGAFLLTLASTRVILATKAAALPSTIQGDQLVRGNGISQLSGAVAQLGGAGVALVAASKVSANPIVFAGAVVYMLGVPTALAIQRAGERRAPERLSQEIRMVVTRIVAGVREVARTPQAGAAISSYFWLRALWSFSVMAILFIARALVVGDEMTELVITGGAGALGAVIGFIGAARAVERFETTARLVLVAAITTGIVVAALGWVESEVSLVVIGFTLGCGFFLAKISLDTMVQEALGDGFRGRAFSLYDISYNLAWVLAASVMKVAWEEGRQGELLSAMGVVFVIGMLGLALWYRSAGLLTSGEST